MSQEKLIISYQAYVQLMNEKNLIGHDPSTETRPHKLRQIGAVQQRSMFPPEHIQNILDAEMFLWPSISTILAARIKDDFYEQFGKNTEKKNDALEHFKEEMRIIATSVARYLSELLTQMAHIDTTLIVGYYWAWDCSGRAKLRENLSKLVPLFCDFDITYQLPTQTSFQKNFGQKPDDAYKGYFSKCPFTQSSQAIFAELTDAFTQLPITKPPCQHLEDTIIIAHAFEDAFIHIFFISIHLTLTEILRSHHIDL